MSSHQQPKYGKPHFGVTKYGGPALIHHSVPHPGYARMFSLKKRGPTGSSFWKCVGCDKLKRQNPKRTEKVPLLTMDVDGNLRTDPDFPLNASHFCPLLTIDEVENKQDNRVRIAAKKGKKWLETLPAAMIPTLYSSALIKPRIFERNLVHNMSAATGSVQLSNMSPIDTQTLDFVGGCMDFEDQSVLNATISTDDDNSIFSTVDELESKPVEILNNHCLTTSNFGYDFGRSIDTNIPSTSTNSGGICDFGAGCFAYGTSIENEIITEAGLEHIAMNGSYSKDIKTSATRPQSHEMTYSVSPGIPKSSGQPTGGSQINGGTDTNHFALDRGLVLSEVVREALLDAVYGADVVVVTAGGKEDVAKIITLMKSVGKKCKLIDMNDDSTGAALKERQAFLESTFCFTGYPAVFIKGDFVGGLPDLVKLHSRGALTTWFHPHDYDLVVVGGGSGGLAAAKEAAKFGKRVACLDFVKPSPKGTTWGLGGTCVNVGCIPKKLMHQAALLGKSLKDAKKFGWNYESETVTHSWGSMKVAIQEHIASLNWNYRVQLREKNVTYLNAFGSFSGSHSLKTVDKRGVSKTITADTFLLATGLRPKYDDKPGVKEYAITSDDLFSLPHCPGKTLLVGASYVSLECAGFLHGIGLDVTVMVRSILLRGFDQDMAERIGSHMEGEGIKFMRGFVPARITKVADGAPGRYRVFATQGDAAPETDCGEFNSIVYAIGREALTDSLNLELCHVVTNKSNKKIVVRGNEQSSCPYVYAIGDLLDGKPELTPMAIHAGRLWARRKYDRETVLCDYNNVPTTVFTPLEYGSCGMSEDVAKEKYKDRLQVYHNTFTPLEYTVAKRSGDLGACYAKLICATIREDAKKLLAPQNLRVVGFHYLGPNAGEVTQGFAMALRFHATKADFDGLVGIHPTTAEIFTSMNILKKENQVLESGGGC